MKHIIEDDREIKALSKDWWSVRVGEDKITKIVPYAEYGPMGYVTWFAIYKGSFLWQRVDSIGLQVIYKGPQ